MDASNVFGMTEQELESAFTELGLPGYRAEQVFYWLYNRGVKCFDEMGNLPKTLRAELAQSFRIDRPEVLSERSSSDGTRKMLVGLADAARVEAVLIPSEKAGEKTSKRLTLCLSTQTGCALDCAFCATALMKRPRNLTAGEIIGQYLAIQAVSTQRISNLVYMGMGEPLLNYDETMKSVELITHERTCGPGAAHITISTAGLPDGIRRLADEGRKTKLAISLHASDDALRERLMPVNKRYPLPALIDAADYYYRKTRKRITWEYILFDGLNDGEADLRRLLKLAGRVPSKFNLIPYHPSGQVRGNGEMRLAPSPPSRIQAFADRLRERNITVMLRSSSGVDIDAACGQLALRPESALPRSQEFA